MEAIDLLLQASEGTFGNSDFAFKEETNYLNLKDESSSITAENDVINAILQLKDNNRSRSDTMQTTTSSFTLPLLPVNNNSYPSNNTNSGNNNSSSNVTKDDACEPFVIKIDPIYNERRRPRAMSEPWISTTTSHPVIAAANGAGIGGAATPQLTFQLRSHTNNISSTLLSLRNAIHSPIKQPSSLATASIRHDYMVTQKVSANTFPFSNSTTPPTQAGIAAVVPSFEEFSAIINKNGRVGIYTKEERYLIIKRFREKRQRRIWKKKIRYECRKDLADKRCRVKGRFVKAAAGSAMILDQEEVMSSSASSSHSSSEAANATLAASANNHHGSGVVNGISYGSRGNGYRGQQQAKHVHYPHGHRQQQQQQAAHKATAAVKNNAMTTAAVVKGGYFFSNQNGSGGGEDKLKYLTSVLGSMDDGDGYEDEQVEDDDEEEDEDEREEDDEAEEDDNQPYKRLRRHSIAY